MTTISYIQNGTYKQVTIPNKECHDMVTAKVWLAEELQISRITQKHAYLPGTDNKLLTAGIDPNSLQYSNP